MLFSLGLKLLNCSAWLRLELNTKMGLNHPTHKPQRLMLGGSEDGPLQEPFKELQEEIIRSAEY